MTTTHDRLPSGPAERTYEGGQELSSADVVAGAERLREPARCCGCPRPTPPSSKTKTGPLTTRRMIINMGPQHPSTHGVLRLMLELEGETVLRCKPIIYRCN